MKRDRHHPACDSQLGPDFKVEPGAVTMTIGICVAFECWDEFGEPPADYREDMRP